MKTTSLYALAAAGIVLGGMAFASTPVKAADLGYASDLEERVAELEATTVRKGNRKVSLEMYGQVNRALVMWDDGVDSDTTIVDNTHSPTRFGLKGSGKFGPGWKSGFWLEFEVNDAASHKVSNFNEEGNGETVINTRQANMWIENDRLGRVTVGHGSPATDDLTFINVGGAGVASDGRALWNTSFQLRSAISGAGMGLKWGNIVNGLDTDRGDFVRYDSPSLYGFILSAAWGEDDQWDVALRYKADWKSIRIAGGVGYYYQGDAGPTGAGGGLRREEIKGSLSAKHVPTGLYVAFGAGQRQNEGGAVNSYTPDQNFWYVQGGIDKRFFSVGATTLFGEYGSYSDFGAGDVMIGGGANVSNGLVGGVGNGVLASSDVDRWGLGVVQKFDASALEVYALYQHFTADVSVFANGGATTVDAPTEDFDAVIVGSRIKF
jgi:hypothetical protein